MDIEWLQQVPLWFSLQKTHTSAGGDNRNRVRGLGTLLSDVQLALFVFLMPNLQYKRSPQLCRLKRHLYS